MRRESGLDGQGPAGEPVEELLATIVEDAIKAARMPEDDWLALSHSPFVPLAIPVSTGRQYRITQNGVDAAHKLTDRSWEERKDLRQRVSRQAFERLTFESIGRSIRDAARRVREEAGDDEAGGEIEPAFYEELAERFGKTLDGMAEKVGGDVDQHVPCELFRADQAVPAFQVGPVDFRPRAEWIERFVRDSEAREIIARVERRELTVDEVSRRATASGIGQVSGDALTALASLRAFAWVGTIRTSGHEFRRSHLKASVMVDLAMDAVGLRFHAEEARRFARSGRAYLPAEDRLATSVDDSRLIHGSSVHVPGLASRPGELAKWMREQRGFIDAAGRILDVYLKHRQKGEAPLLVERWVNALHWVGEARREVSDSMAVVKYGCALDGITGGEGNVDAMAAFVKAVLEPRAGEERKGGAVSIDDAVQMVYGKDGRSGVAHGGTPGLLEDFEKPRRVGDCLLAGLFYPVTLALAELIEEGSEALTFSRRNAVRALEVRASKMM